MLHLPHRRKKQVVKSSALSHYKTLFSTVRSKKEYPRTRPISVVHERAKFLQPTTTSGVISLNKVNLSFGKSQIINNLNLKIKPGKIFGIIGASGSGKTTILRLIIGYYKPSEGEITFNNEPINKKINPLRANFGFASQENSFYYNLNVEENIHYFGRMYGLSEDYLHENIDRVLDLVDLGYAKKILARHLSGGMQRRLDFACSLIHNPNILMLDEPTEDLDPHLRNEFLKLIKDINRNGTTVIFTTHLLNEAEHLCDEVAIINEGKLLAVGSPEELRNTYMKGSEIHLIIRDNDYSKYVKQLKNLKLKVLKNKLIVYIPEKGKAILTLKKILTQVYKNKDELILADIRKPSLAEVFNNLTKNEQKKRKAKRKA